MQGSHDHRLNFETFTSKTQRSQVSQSDMKMLKISANLCAAACLCGIFNADPFRIFCDGLAEPRGRVYSELTPRKAVILRAQQPVGVKGLIPRWGEDPLPNEMLQLNKKIMKR